MVNTWKLLFAAASLCVVVASASAALAQSNARIRIVSPPNGGIVPVGEVEVKVATENFTLGDEHHWHLYVDGELRSMVANGATSWTTKITTSGPHEIRVALSDDEHDDLGSATIYVTAAPRTPRETPFNVPQMSVVMGALVLAIVTILAVSLRASRRSIV